MTGIYLKCDKCGKTLGGEEVTDFTEHSLHWSHASRLQDAARKLGWSGPLTRESDNDMCPKCAKDVQKNHST